MPTYLKNILTIYLCLIHTYIHLTLELSQINYKKQNFYFLYLPFTRNTRFYDPFFFYILKPTKPSKCIIRIDWVTVGIMNINTKLK